MTQTMDRPVLTTDERLERLSEQVGELTDALHRNQAEREQLTELIGEINLVARPAMDVAMTQLGQFEEKGYFTFAKESVAVADTIVTSFSPEDVKALGENVVTILQTVREMTQPEVMALVRRTAETAQDSDEEFTTPPSTFALLRRMRDPQVRRGLARVMAMLETVGADVKRPPTPTPQTPPQGER